MAKTTKTNQRVVAESHYRVKWEIDVYTGSSFDAALQAHDYQQRPTEATVFSVTNVDTGQQVEIDLLDNVKFREQMLKASAKE